MQIITDSTTINNKHGKPISYITQGDFIIQNIVNNNKTNITKGGFPTDLVNPVSLGFYYKYNNSANTNDSALVIADFTRYSGGTRTNLGRFISRLKPSASYVLQTLNINIPAGSQADTANIIISSSNYLSKTLNLTQCIGNTLLIDDLAFGYSSSGYKISGAVTYDNSKNTAMSSIKVYLKNTSDKIIDSTTTDASGNFQFSNVANGTYTLSGSCSKTPYAPKPTEALMVNRNYIGVYTFTTPLRKSSADVSADGKINPTDALMINRKYIGVLKSFKLASWIFEKVSATVNGSDIVVNFKAICAGDVAGKFEPK
jgi:hypothetical protein